MPFLCVYWSGGPTYVFDSVVTLSMLVDLLSFRVLFLGRLCQSFTDQCPNIKLVMEGGGGGEVEGNVRGTPRLALLYLVYCVPFMVVGGLTKKKE